MITNFDQLLEKVRQPGKTTVAVAAPHSVAVLTSIMKAENEEISHGILVGDENKIKKIARENDLKINECDIVHESNDIKAALKATEIVSTGKAQVLMKGLIHTDDFLRAVINPDIGLRTGKRLSQVMILEVKKFQKLIFVTDGAMNIAPNFEEKAEIARNAISLARLFGIERPKVAVLAATELVNPKMPATQDAAILSLMSHRGQFEAGVIEGPFALDNAVSIEAANIKGIKNEVAGTADILLVPDIEAGNIMYKAYVYFADGRSAGVLVGARNPVVVTSRADNWETMFLSISTAVYMQEIQTTQVKLGKIV